MAKFKVNQSVYIKHQGANPWRIVQIDNPERGDHALYHLRDSRNTYEREFGYNLIGTDEPDASARAHNNIVSLELLRKSGISQQEFQKMRGEMQRKGASAVHFIRGKDGRLVYKADGTTIGNSANPVVANALAARNAQHFHGESEVKSVLNSAVAANADTEASIEAEAKKLAKEVLAIASKFDTLQKRLHKIGVYYTDYQAAANDLRNVHSVLS